MVSLAEASAISRFDRVSQSADYAVRDLLADPDDPLALASYLWTFRQHNLTSINGRALVRWGENWARQIFVERKIGPRLDEEVASAALAVAALAETSALSKIRDEIRTGLAELLSTELSKGPHLIASRQWVVDVSKPVHPLEKLELLGNSLIESKRKKGTAHAHPKKRNS